MFKSINSVVPSKKKFFFYYGALSLFLSLLIFSFGLYVYLLKNLDDRTEAAKDALTNRMNGIFKELTLVVDGATSSCDAANLKHLRRSTFYSPTFKEFGLFNEKYRIYCTDFGARNFPIFNSIAERIQQSPEHTTVSLVNSNTLGESTFFAFYQGPNGIGANALAPPSELAVEVNHILLPDYFYELTLGRQILYSNKNGIDSDILNKRLVSLDDWSMELAVFLPSSLYWHCFFSFLPVVLFCCILLCLIFCAFHWSILYYRHSLSHSIRRAIRDNEIDVHFQPIVSLKAGEPHELEALIRWNSPYHGQVSPLAIVEISEQLGLIDDLTWMVIRKVGDFYREYPAPLKGINTSVNVDRYSLLKESFAPSLLSILALYPELEGRLGLEVTETSALTAVELPLMVSRFEHIKALGIRLSVDDFGTGYAGLDFLRRFPYDTLKLDKIFIDSLQDDQFTRQVLTSITNLAKELNMELVAEGVERQEQLNAVRELGVDRVQGYYYSRPLPKVQVIEWMEKNPT
jgi:EAL domain-containing protein (putative c-di-GMP-specific phosphodiesterase class I)